MMLPCQWCSFSGKKDKVVLFTCYASDVINGSFSWCCDEDVRKRSKREVYAINGSRPQNIYVISYMGSICLSHGKRSQSAGVDASKAFQSRTLCGTLPRFQREGLSNSRSKYSRNLQKTAKFVFLECKLMCSLFLSTQSSLLWESFIPPILALWSCLICQKLWHCCLSQKGTTVRGGSKVQLVSWSISI